MSLVMLAYAYKKENGNFLWTSERYRADEREAEGKELYTRRVWLGRGGRAWFKPGDKWKLLREGKTQ